MTRDPRPRVLAPVVAPFMLGFVLGAGLAGLFWLAIGGTGP